MVYRSSFLISIGAVKQRFIVLIVLLFLFGCNHKKRSVLIDEFRSSNADKVPEISVHRGGKGIPYYPENSLETLSYLNQRIAAIYEIDISETKDGQLVLFHDNSLERTTTGSGLLRTKTMSELNGLFLKDDNNAITSFKIPLFETVLQWARNHGVILTIDIKQGVSIKKVIKAIENTRTEDNCIIITYSVEQALKTHELAPGLLLSVSARNNRELDDLLNSGLPTENMIAFTGTRLSSVDLYARLREQNILSMLGTLGNLDQRAAARGNELYRDWMDLGVDIIATDRPLDVYEVLKTFKK